jgi:hypothetical protein
VDDAGAHERRRLARRLPALLALSLVALAGAALAWLLFADRAGTLPSAMAAAAAGAIGVVGWLGVRSCLGRYDRDLAAARDALLGAVAESGGGERPPEESPRAPVKPRP